ncbi:MAG: hypothetical protein ACOCRX_01790 [Candidatus Woesearchaeota archaeon]
MIKKGHITNIIVKESLNQVSTNLIFKTKNDKYILKDYFKPFLIIKKNEIKYFFKKYSKHIHRVEKEHLKKDDFAPIKSNKEKKVNENNRLYYKCYISHLKKFKKIKKDKEFNYLYPNITLKQKYFLEKNISPFSIVESEFEKNPLKDEYEVNYIKDSFEEEELKYKNIFLKIFSKNLILTSTDKRIKVFSTYTHKETIQKIKTKIDHVQDIKTIKFENPEELINGFFNFILSIEYDFLITSNKNFKKDLNVLINKINNKKISNKANTYISLKDSIINKMIHIDIIELYNSLFKKRDNIYFKLNLENKPIEMMIKNLEFYYDYKFNIKSKNIVELIVNFMEDLLEYLFSFSKLLKQDMTFYKNGLSLSSYIEMRSYLKREIIENKGKLNFFNEKQDIFLKFNNKIKKRTVEDQSIIHETNIKKLVKYGLNHSIKKDLPVESKNRLIKKYKKESNKSFLKIKEHYKRYGDSANLLYLKHLLIKTILDFKISPNNFLKVKKKSKNHLNNEKVMVSSTNDETIIQKREEYFIIKKREDKLLEHIKELYYIYEKLNLSSNPKIKYKKIFYDYFLQNYFYEYVNLFEKEEDLLSIFSVLLKKKEKEIESRLDNKNFIQKFSPNIFLFSTHELLSPIKYNKEINEITNEYHGKTSKLKYKLNPFFKASIITSKKLSKLKKYNHKQKLIDNFDYTEIVILNDEVYTLFNNLENHENFNSYIILIDNLLKEKEKYHNIL